LNVHFMGGWRFWRTYEKIVPSAHLQSNDR
jgi:hypothetical protein